MKELNKNEFELAILAILHKNNVFEYIDDDTRFNKINIFSFEINSFYIDCEYYDKSRNVLNFFKQIDNGLLLAKDLINLLKRIGVVGKNCHIRDLDIELDAVLDPIINLTTFIK